MILLKATTESLKVVTSSTANIDYSVSWVDVTTTAFTPSTSEGKISTATSTTLLSAPAGSTQRQVKLITITNTHASASNTVTVQKDISGTTYQLTPATTLLAGEVLSYLDKKSWRVYSASGIDSSSLAGGTDTTIQYNSAGVLGGDADLTWNATNKTLTMGGTDTEIVMKGITNEPTAPAAGNLTIYSKAVSGKMQLKIKGPSGLDTPLQADLKQNNWIMWAPGVAAGSFQNGTGTTLGTSAVVLPTISNNYTILRRSTFASVVTTQNQQVGVRTEARFFRGNADGMGGFMFFCRFGFDSIKTGMRAFVGLTSGTTAVVTVNPSTLTNMLGFGFDLGETAWTFMHNDASGTCTKETISGQGTLATNNTGYDALIFCPPNGGTVYYRLDRADTGATICDSSVTTDLPVNTTMLTAQCIMSNGTANIVVGDAKLGINRIYVETDR